MIVNTKSLILSVLQDVYYVIDKDRYLICHVMLSYQNNIHFHESNKGFIMTIVYQKIEYLTG